MTLLQNKFKSKNDTFLYIPIIIFIQIYIINMAYEGYNDISIPSKWKYAYIFRKDCD
jgi:hypothetical protein